MATASTTATIRSSWIVSPAWDLAYLVATPLVVVPAVLLAVRHWFTPEQITLAVISFASMGHHLPGFMRAYGDRHLFGRFRLRFLLMPPLIFGLALLFSPPSWLAGTLGMHWQHLHGLELILLLWGTWHGLMQTYGFMRIYDLKRGIGDKWTARLDHWLCVVLFGCGYLFSDARMYGTAEVMWQVGLPVFDRAALAAVRTAAAMLAALVIGLYAVQVWRQQRYGAGASWNKVLLAATTGWIYWYTGRISTNLLIGLAMFEIYHAIQYYAIVWFYNRRIVERDGSRFGWLAFLFRDRWAMLGLYLALIAAFGSIRFFTVDTADYVFRGGELDAHKLLIAFLVTSTFLHYYFDGFIWKVSESQTQRGLFGGSIRESLPMRIVPALRHASKWSVFFAAAGLFLFLESRQPDYETNQQSILQRLAALTPDLPELQIQLSRDALERGNTDLAIRLAKSALALRPESHSAHGDLAVALMAAGDDRAAAPLLQRAVLLEPKQWRYHTNLGLIYTNLGRLEDAGAAFRTAVALAPDDPMPYVRLARWLVQQDQPERAPAIFEQAMERGGDPFALALEQVEALCRAGRGAEAHSLAERLARENPLSADAHLALGTASLAQGQARQAIELLARAVELDPQHLVARLQLGSALYTDGRLNEAELALARVLEDDPQHAEGLANLGAVLLAQGRLADAETRLREALVVRPNLNSARLNLGVALLRQGWKAAAGEQLQQVLDSGQEVPEQLLTEAGLNIRTKR